MQELPYPVVGLLIGLLLPYTVYVLIKWGTWGFYDGRDGFYRNQLRNCYERLVSTKRKGEHDGVEDRT